MSGTRDVIAEAAEWLSQNTPTNWGEHERRLFDVVEESERLQAENARLERSRDQLLGFIKGVSVNCGKLVAAEEKEE